MDLVALLLRTPVVAPLLHATFVVLAAVQRLFGPGTAMLERRRQRWLHRAETLADLVGGYTTERTGLEEYVCSVPVPPAELERELWRRGFHRNLLAAKKYRGPDGRRQWSVGSWVHRERFRADDQLHVTLFRRPDGVDCYAHRETSPVVHPLAHWRRRGKVDGDPDGRLRDALDAAGLERFRDAKLAADGSIEHR